MILIKITKTQHKDKNDKFQKIDNIVRQKLKHENKK